MYLYSSPKERRKRYLVFRLKIYLIVFLFLSVFVGLFYFINNSNFWQIENINVFGNKRSSPEQIISSLKPIVLNGIIGRFLGVDHYLSWFFLKKVSLNDPVFANLVILKDLFNKEIKVNVIESEPYGSWCIEKQISAEADNGNSFDCWWFDKDGIIFEKAPYTEGTLVLKIIDLSAKPVILGEKILEEKKFLYLNSIFKSAGTLGIITDSFEYNRGLEEISAKLFDNIKIFFGLRFDPADNINAAKVLKEKDEFKNLEYIDLRVENRVYLKK